MSLDGYNYSVALVDMVSLYTSDPALKEEAVKVAGLLLFDRSDLLVQDYWVEGSNGLGLFHSDNEKCVIGISKERVWSDEIDLAHLSSSSLKIPLELNGYQFVYSISALPGLLSRTKLVTVMPRYCIINCMDEKVLTVTHLLTH